MRTPRAACRAVALVLVALLSLLLPEVATAEDGSLSISSDGVDWAPSAPGPLFAGGLVMVPGESVSASLRLRSTASTPGSLEVRVTNAHASSVATARAFAVGVDIERGGELVSSLPRTEWADLEETSAASPAVRLEPGGMVTVIVTIDLDAQQNDRAAQNGTIALDLAVSFRDAAAAGGEPPHVLPVVPPTAPSSPGPSAGQSPRPSAGQSARPAVGQSPRPSAGQPPRSAVGQSPRPAVGQSPRHPEVQVPATESAPAGATGPGALAVTGFTAGALVAVAALLIGAGITLLRSRRREESS